MTRFVGILLGTFIILGMQLILATSLPFIVAEIGGENLYSWVLSSYMLASIAIIPLSSKLADMYGKKKFYILGMGIFALGSIWGGFAPAMLPLISARIIQGIGAGIITPVSLAMISDMFPPEKRGKMISVFGFVQLLANLLSPPLGSFITKQFSWHWIFFITAAMVVLSTLLVAFNGKEQQGKSAMKLSDVDVLGGLTFGAFCVFIVGFSKIIGSRNQLIIEIVFLIAAVFAAVLLVTIEKHHKSPIIRIEFFKIKILRRSLSSALLSGAIMYGLVTILPLCGITFNKQGFNIDESKLLLSFTIGLTLGILISNKLAGMFKSLPLNKLLWILMSIVSGFTLYSVVSANLVTFIILILCLGICTGTIMATFLINSQNAVSKEDRTVLSGLVQLNRYFGGAIGLTILAGMLPKASMITGSGQFLGAFGLLVLLCGVGFINEVL